MRGRYRTHKERRCLCKHKYCASHPLVHLTLLYISLFFNLLCIERWEEDIELTRRDGFRADIAPLNLSHSALSANKSPRLKAPAAPRLLTSSDLHLPIKTRAQEPHTPEGQGFLPVGMVSMCCKSITGNFSWTKVKRVSSPSETHTTYPTRLLNGTYAKWRQFQFFWTFRC